MREASYRTSAQRSDSPAIPRALPNLELRLLVTLVALAAAVALGIAMHGNNVLDVDLDVTVRVQRLQGDAVRLVADGANILGSTLGASVATTIAIAIAAIRHARWELLFLISLLALRLLATQLKPLFASPRPPADLVLRIGDWEGTGYPSGHALTASMMALGLAILAWRSVPSRTAALGGIAFLMTLMVVVGWARIWSGAHWPTDVLGGYAFGLAIVSTATLVADVVLRRHMPAGRAPRTGSEA
jgi:undecaprenyl-diphosphatase